MFILSAGMPKSSSTLLNLYQKQILMMRIPVNGQQAFEDRISEGKLNGVGNFIHDLEDPNTVENLISLSEDVGPFVVKSHTSLSDRLVEGIRGGQIQATYIHRDPRDVILSAMDHGKRPANHPTMSSFFLRFDTLPHAIPLVKEFCRVSIAWVSSGLCDIYTYHDLMVDPVAQLSRFCHSINVEPNRLMIQTLIDDFTRTTKMWKRQYNTGKLLRFPEEMPADEIALCNRELAFELESLGYHP